MAFFAAIIAGATANLDLVWAASDSLNLLMFLPNVASLLLLSPIIFRQTDKYRQEKISRRKQK